MYVQEDLARFRDHRNGETGWLEWIRDCDRLWVCYLRGDAECEVLCATSQAWEEFERSKKEARLSSDGVKSDDGICGSLRFCLIDQNLDVSIKKRSSDFEHDFRSLATMSQRFFVVDCFEYDLK